MNHFINLEKAVELTSRYRLHQNSILDAAYRDKGVLPTCESFDRSAIEALLAQKGCAGLRIRYGLEAEMTLHAVLVAYDETGKDILPSVKGEGLSEEEEEEDGLVVDKSVRCPPSCPPPSPLNP